MTRPALAVVTDLMFGSKIKGTADAVGATVLFARNQDVLMKEAPAASVILLDLGTRWLTPQMITELKSITHAQVIAFVAHTDAESIRAAQAAGADKVLARSAFVVQLPEILKQHGRG
jgi:DNA-binding NarL/FixJ family response regulator